MKKLFMLIGPALSMFTSVGAQPQQAGVPGELRPVTQPAFSMTSIMDGAHRSGVVIDESSRLSRAPQRVADADMSLFNGRTIYGTLINSTLWSNYSITQVPYGIYSFTMGSTTAPVGHITDFNYGFKSSAWGRNRFYGIVPLSIMGVLNGARYITIDTQNWAETKNVMWDTSYGTYSLIACAMAYDPTDDTFYAFQYKEDLSGLNWGKFDIAEDKFEQIAAYRGRTMVMTLAPAPDGQMYYIDGAGDLYTINKANGRTSLVGNTGVTPAQYDQSMTYDGKTGTFLWAAQSAEGSVLYSVDPTTAVTTRVMAFANNEQFVGLYITDSEAPAGAPGAVARAQMQFADNGSLDANITFIMPTRTYGGATLDGAVNLNVWLDGENIKGVPVEPGTSVSIPVTLDEGNHYVCITTDNEAGYSPMRYIYKYAGYDTPKQPGNVTLAIADGVNKVTWDAPTGGINDGYIDYDNLTYDIVRLPGDVTVATGVKACEFTEPTPADMQSYYYRVYAVNNGHRSEYAESNHLLGGDSFTVPYSQSFADPAIFADFFKAVDRDGNGVTWRQGYTTEVRNDYYEKSVDADDWLISPAIIMQPGIKYRFTMNMKTFTPNYPETFEVLIGTDRDDLSTFSVIKREVDFTEIASEFGDYTVDYTVDAADDYYMAVRYCSPADANGSLMMIRSISVDVIGNVLAPAKVESLTITPDSEGALSAVVAFEAPTLDLKDSALTSITSIEVYRSGTDAPVHVFTDVTPGSQLSFNDTGVPALGIYSYSIVPKNDNGTGEIISAEEFIGIYTAPYFTNFDDQKYSELWTTYLDVDDNENNWYGWSWTDNENTHGTHFTLYYYLMEDRPTDIWLFTPKFKLEENTVYTVNYDALISYSSYPDMEWSLSYGTSATPEGMTAKIGDIPSTGYFMESRENYFVNREAGQYFIGFETYGATKYDYFSGAIDNFGLTRRASAFAPFEITNYSSEADQSGELKATLKFKTPKVNYYKDNLSSDEDLTVKIYRGRNATTPKQTLTAKPGENITWVDQETQHGFNYYMITCENQYGRGEVLLDTLFVGRDVPALVEDCTFRGTPDNGSAVIEWTCPSTGRNGGLVLPDEVKYNVYSYDRANDQLTLIEGGITGTSYTVQLNYTGEQQLYYFAVAAENTEGEGYATASSVLLGQLYELPFNESFANAEMSTQLWQMFPMIENATSWGMDNPSGTYNGCTGPQDDDGGCLYMYNGSQYETYIGALLVTPKIHLSTETGNQLRFWTYNFKETYPNKAYIQVAISADDTNAVAIKNIYVGGLLEKGWTENVISLDAYRNSNFVSIVFLGITGGYQDVIYMDNVSVSNPNVGGIWSGTIDDGVDQPIYDLRGIEVTNPTLPGIYIQGNQKIIVK